MPYRIGSDLAEVLKNARAHESFDVNIFLKYDPLKERTRARAFSSPVDNTGSAVEAIKNRCLESQRSLREHLEASSRSRSFALDDAVVPGTQRIKSFWINNSIGVEVGLSVIEDLMRREDVAYIELSRHAEIEELIDQAASGAGSLVPPQPADVVPQPTWSVKQINAPLLWQLGLNGAGVLVAVIDTGVNYRHPDLVSNMWDGGTELPNHGFDFQNQDNNPIDEHGHGTACAGIVAGNGSSGTATGVAPAAKIMAIRAGGSERDFWQGMQFAITHGVQVISMSMTWKQPRHPDNPGWRRVCETILAAGVLHANSSGNQGNDLTFPVPFNIGAPGNCPPPKMHPLQHAGGTSSAISCGNVNDVDELEFDSGRGPSSWEEGPFQDFPFSNGTAQGLIKPDICAPGKGSISCNFRFPDDANSKPYRPFGGTSAATPHIAGCLALLADACLRAGKPIVPARCQEALENTAKPIRGQTAPKENHFGAGRVDVFAAFQYGRTEGWW